MAARRKRAPEPVVVEDAPAPRAARAAAPPPTIILRWAQTHGQVTEVETTMAQLTGEGVEVPNYAARLVIVS